MRFCIAVREHMHSRQGITDLVTEGSCCIGYIYKTGAVLGATFDEDVETDSFVKCQAKSENICIICNDNN